MKSPLWVVVLSALLSLGMLMPAAADDDGERRGEHFGEWFKSRGGGENRGKPIQPARVNVTFQQECSACHVAYQPGLLPAESWRKIMSGLDKHFGTDASLSVEESDEISGYLVNNASNRWKVDTSPMRVTESAWFKRKHDEHEIRPQVWSNPKVKSPANCAACHPDADKGDYEEHRVRIPR
jgi:hypothetical protein